MPLRRRAKDAPAPAAATPEPRAKSPPVSPTRAAKKDVAPAAATAPSPKRSNSSSKKPASSASPSSFDLDALLHQQRTRRRLLSALAALAALAASTYALWQQNKALRAALSPLAQLARETELFGGGLSAWEAMRDGVSEALRTGPSSSAASSPGAAAAAAGLGPHHPVIIIPGFVTSSLELWSGPKCAQKYFRSRFWGGLSMTTRLLGDKRCWLETMALDEGTGLDPVTTTSRAGDGEEEDEEEEEGKKGMEEVNGDGGTENKKPKRNSRRRRTTRLRAVEGLAGVDYFMPGYGVWARLIEELARLGYDATNLAAETYDWRLSVPNLERRDGFFTRLKARCEAMVATNVKENGEKRKIALLAHSWGDSVARAFFLWADHKDPGWTERHVAAYANIAGPTLGAAKSLPALLSGETRDTAELGAVAAFLGENYVPRGLRAALFRTWPGAYGMLPLGGSRVWGKPLLKRKKKRENERSSSSFSEGGGAPDDTPAMRRRGVSHGALLTVDGEELDVEGALRVLSASLPGRAAAHVAEALAAAVGGEEEEQEESRRGGSNGGGKVRRRFGSSSGDDGDGAAPETPCHGGAVDPLRCPLPNAPSMRLFCIYGTGKPTERAYNYVRTATTPAAAAASEGKEAARGSSTPSKAASAAAAAAQAAEELRIDTEASEDAREVAESAVEESEGEGEEGNGGGERGKGGEKNAAPSPAPAHSSRALGSLESGVRVSDGDGTVPLLSLGTLCARHWRADPLDKGRKSSSSRLNPANLSVVTREARHSPRDFLLGGTLDPRGGDGSADHVDILMNAEVLEDVIAIVAGKGGELEDRFYSSIREIAQKIEI